jgi:hypothetical protein
MGEAPRELCASIYLQALKPYDGLPYFSRIVTESEITPS